MLEPLLLGPTLDSTFTPWRPSLLPLAHGNEQCASGMMRLRRKKVFTPMCLHAGDLISEVINVTGRWPDCDIFSNLWLSRFGTNASGLFIEVGANIGACTLQMLLLTQATVVAVEPNPANLFYLTSSLHGMRKLWRDRVVVLPIGASDSPGISRIFVEHSWRGTNYGNSVLLPDAHAAARIQLGPRKALRAVETAGRAESITIRTLDAVLAPLLATLPAAQHAMMMKVDTQGFECRVLGGAPQLLRSVQALVTEVDEKFLAPQNCSAAMLEDHVRRSGFNEVKTHKSMSEASLVALRT